MHESVQDVRNRHQEIQLSKESCHPGYQTLSERKFSFRERLVPRVENCLLCCKNLLIFEKDPSIMQQSTVYGLLPKTCLRLVNSQIVVEKIGLVSRSNIYVNVVHFNLCTSLICFRTISILACK